MFHVSTIFGFNFRFVHTNMAVMKAFIVPNSKWSFIISAYQPFSACNLNFLEKLRGHTDSQPVARKEIKPTSVPVMYRFSRKAAAAIFEANLPDKYLQNRVGMMEASTQPDCRWRHIKLFFTLILIPANASKNLLDTQWLHLSRYALLVIFATVVWTLK